MIRNFWANERPTTTENVTETENPNYPKSQTKAETPRKIGKVQIIEDQMKNLELSKLKNENRKLEFKILRFEAEMARLKTENDVAENEISNRYKLTYICPLTTKN